jgi:FKBP-type peptidyl-prolyl cis-trans isomerase
MGAILLALVAAGPVLSPTRLPAIQSGAARLSRLVMQQAPAAEEAYVTTASGLRYLDVKVGGGELAEKGAMVKVDYTGTLTDGKEFDSSQGRGPITFELGAGRVIPG